MDKFAAWAKQTIREWQLFGFLLGWIFGHFGHDVALYDWISTQVDSYNVVEHDSKWNPFD